MNLDEHDDIIFAPITKFMSFEMLFLLRAQVVMMLNHRARNQILILRVFLIFIISFDWIEAS